MKRLALVAPLILSVLLALPVPAQTAKPKIHRLEAAPNTVAYGYYWSEAKPALRIASGDIIDMWNDSLAI